MVQQNSNMNRCVLDLTGKGNTKDFLRLSDDIFTNVFITGSTGSGKTTSSFAAIVNGLLDARHQSPDERVGFVVSTYKSSEIATWEKWAFDNGREDDIIKISAGDKGVFNLLQHYSGEEPANAVNALVNLSSLATEGGQQKEEKFWSTQLRKRLDRLIRLLTLSGAELNITNLYRLHLSAPNDVEQAHDVKFQEKSFCHQMMALAAEKKGERHPDFKMVEDYFYQEMVYLNDRTASSINSICSATLEPFLSSKILNDLYTHGSSLDLNEVFSGKIILLDLDIQRHQYIGRLGQNLLIHIFQKSVEQRDLSRYGNPLIFAHDEFQHFITPYTTSFLSTCRSSKCGSILVTQNISNLHAALGDGRASEAKVNSLLALVNTKVFHANADPLHTNEFAAKLIGQDFRNLSNFHISGHQQSSAGSSQALHYRVQPHEFSTLRSGGHSNEFLVDAYITTTGRKFSNDSHAMKVTFKQSFA